MTSKVLYSNLLKEDIKRRIWCIVLACIVFLFAGPIFFLLYLSDGGSAPLFFVEEAESYLYAYEKFVQIFFMNSVFNGIITILGAFICAFNGFGYLYSNKKVDFYHSMPVKRNRLFAASYLNGILIYIIPFMVSTVLCIMIAASQGMLFYNGSLPLEGPTVMNAALGSLAVNIIHFLLIYNICICVIMLTGHMISGLFVTALSLFYVPALKLIWDGLCQVYLVTYGAWRSDFYLNLQFSSPVIALFWNLSDLVQRRSILIFLIIELLFSGLLFAAGIYLYQKRPSEAAGKATAFSILQAPLRILVTITGAIGFGMLFSLMVSANGWVWMIFGTIAGAVLIHGIMEVLFYFDIKAIFRHKLQALICMVATLLIIFAFRYDWFGYDKYLPEQNKIVEMAVVLEDVNSNDSYYDFERQEYENKTEYMLKNMHMQDIEKPYELARSCVSFIKEGRPAQFRDTDELMTGISIRYTLSSGSSKTRRYWVPLATVYESMREIYNTKEYKQTAFQLGNLKPELLQGAEFITAYTDQGIEVDKEYRQALVEAYEKDLLAFDMDSIKSEAAIGRLNIFAGHKQNIRYEYTVYPEFINTITLLRQAGITEAQLQERLEFENIQRVWVTLNGYNEPMQYQGRGSYSSYSASEVLVMDLRKEKGDSKAADIPEADIRQICDNFVTQYDTWSNRKLLDADYNVDVRIEYIGEDGEYYDLLGSLKEGKLPESVLKLSEFSEENR